VGTSDSQTNDLFDVMSRALDAAAEPNLKPSRDSQSLRLLLDDNARLRKLAIQLSNMLGDLPP
jgi:hypothetical protein